MKRLIPKILMVAGLLAVVALAFRVSWNALRDVASAIGADPTAATVYPLVVDGLVALALVAALTLTGSDRRFALWVLGGYTLASLILNYVHGLVPTLHGGGRVKLADWAPAHWALVLLASSLPVGSIFFGSDLVAKVLHHRPEPADIDQTTVNRSVSDQPESPAGAPEWPLYESADPQPTTAPTATMSEPTDAAAEAAPVGRVRKSTVTATARPRRATGAVPQSARTTRPTRTPEELLTQARSATTDWPHAELTADRIREAVRTSAAKARVLRDTLHAERATQAPPADAERPALHAVPDPQPAPAEQHAGGTGDITPDMPSTDEEKAS